MLPVSDPLLLEQPWRSSPDSTATVEGADFILASGRYEFFRFQQKAIIAFSRIRGFQIRQKWELAPKQQ
jgi:hypothetical protein